jgi:hypothetical protein
MRVHVSGWLEVDDTIDIDSGSRPDNTLPERPPHPGNKPPGRPVLPPSIDNKPPQTPAHPWLPGHWEIVDPGFGKPPLIAFIPADPGFGIEEVPVGPDNSLPGGIWLPLDPDFGKPPSGGCGPIKPKPPIWGWLPKPPDFSKPPETAAPKTY